ncbi:MAG TPA: YaiO family outer membrane beta-barrel protein, partial [Puia sp.]|nr:YaiO family outer membrane beta-barrel protein [Puia sp.]
EAKAAADSALRVDPKDADVRALLSKIREYAAANKIGISYDYVYFDRQYSDPWHLVSIDYSRRTSVGTVTGRLNYANRFRSGGVQGELEAYPHLSHLFYGYLNFGYSADEGLFPRYRAGASLYVNLPSAFEADGGLRYLYFGSNTWIYTFSIGKYYKNFWFNGRAYLTPGGSALSQSFTVTGRWYFGGADDYLSLAAGTGISPDDRSNSQQLASTYALRSHKVEAGWRQSVGKRNVLYASVQWLDQEYLPKTHGNQVDLGIGYQRKF